MGLLSRFRREPNGPSNTEATHDHSDNDLEFNKHEDGPLHIFNWRVIYMGILVSMGGFVRHPYLCTVLPLLTLLQIFGYDTGQISGFLEMDDFKQRFADTTDPETGDLAFTNGRSGTIVALVSTSHPFELHILGLTFQSFLLEHSLEP